MENGFLSENYAQLNGGGVFSESCQMTFDNNKIKSNIGLVNGGGIFLKASSLEMHNIESVNNFARMIGNFGLITMNSKFQSNYLHLYDKGGNAFIIYNDSLAEMKYTYLSTRNGYCPVIARINSRILMDHVYYAENNDTRDDKNVVCTDSTSSALGTLDGSLKLNIDIIFLRLSIFKIFSYFSITLFSFFKEAFQTPV